MTNILNGQSSIFVKFRSILLLKLLPCGLKYMRILSLLFQTQLRFQKKEVEKNQGNEENFF